MAKMTEQNSIVRPHSILIRDRKEMEIEGVQEIISFDEGQIQLKTEAGHMHIAGKNLHVTALQPDAGKAIVDGQIDSISYSGRKVSAARGLLGIFR